MQIWFINNEKANICVIANALPNDMYLMHIIPNAAALKKHMRAGLWVDGHAPQSPNLC
jgi:hypothetical protein